MALGEPGADELFREVIERGSAASDPSTLAVVAWSHRRLGEHDPAARTYQRALSLGGRQLEYIRLDFALALLCSGRAELALREYERAVQALQYVHPLRAYGLLVTAGQDLEQAERLSQVPDAAAARQLLAAALAKYQPQATTESTESRPAAAVT
jgi:tetratricopeptide (TPR) repeat protein